MVVLGVVTGTIVVVELLALVGRRVWAHWKLGRRQPLVDKAMTGLAHALVSGNAPPWPIGRVERRAHRLAALELLPALAGPSRDRLTQLVDDLGLADDAMRTLGRSPRAFARRTAADELAEIRSPRSAELLAEKLGDRDAIVRIACSRGLAHLRDIEHVQRMLEILDRDCRRAPAHSESAMLALAAVAPDALAAFQTSARSPLARSLAALALAGTGDERAMPALLAALAAENAVLSAVSMRAIERLGGPDAIDSLERLRDDADRDAALREEARHALERVHAVGGAT
jgi:HEAT repeat protein